MSSMGLSPIYVNEIFDIIQKINGDGTTVLLVEQNAKKALSIAHKPMYWRRAMLLSAETQRSL